jgi:hypothetical protein
MRRAAHLDPAAAACRMDRLARLLLCLLLGASVTKQQLDARTVYRAAEVLEAAPGLIVSQHSGEGKANQFYLRGFNLDHGTDLRTTSTACWSTSAATRTARAGPT